MSHARTMCAILFGIAGCLSPAKPAERVPWTGPASTPDAEFRKRAPVSEVTALFQGPKIQESRLENGVRILVVERHDLPMVSLSICVRRGAGNMPPAVAYFVSRMLFSGTTQHSEEEIANQLGEIDGGTGADYDGVWVEAKMLSTHLADTFVTLAQLVTSSALPEKQFKKVKERLLDALEEDPADANDALLQVVGATLYPKGHPYRLPVTGDASSVRSITHAGVVDAYRSHFRPDQAAVVVAGNVTASTVRQLARKAFRGWAGEAPVRGDGWGVVAEQAGPRVVLVDRPGLTQSTVYLAALGAERTSPDYDAIVLLNTLLGEPLTGRLSLNLREKRGYTYGAASDFKLRNMPGPFYAGGAVDTASTGDAIREMMKELERLRSERLSGTELTDARSAYRRWLPRRFETVDQTVASLREIALYDLPADEFARLPTRIGQVSAEDIQRVAKHYLAPDRLHVFIVGDASKVQPQLASLGLGPVSVIPSKWHAVPPGSERGDD